MGNQRVYIEGAIAAGAAAEQVADVNSLVPGRLGQKPWRVTAPSMAPGVREIYANAGAVGPRQYVVVNYDGVCPAGGYLERPFTIPAEVTEVRVELDDVRLPDGVSSSPPFEIRVYDATGITLLHTTSVTPTSTWTDVETLPIKVTPATEYRVRVVANVTGQAKFVCGRLRVRPTATSSGFWSNFVRIDANHSIINDNLEVGYANPRYAMQSPFSHIDMLTSADEAAFEVADFVGDYIAGRGRPSVYVNGNPLDPPLDTNIGGIAHCRVKLPASTGMQAVTIYAGPQATSGLPAPATEPRGAFICGIYLPRYARVEVLPERQSASGETIVLYGDSKLAGFYSSSPGRDSIAQILRRAGHRVICQTVGGDALRFSTGSTLSVDACLPLARKLTKENPTIIVLGIGRNDIKAGLFNAADLLEQLGNLATAIHQVDPDVQVKFLTFSHETSGTEETALDTVRAGMRTLAAARAPWCSVLDGAGLWTVAEAANYTSDNVHPNDAGQELKARLILDDISPTARIEYPWTPMRVASLAAWFEGGVGLVGGAAGAVVATGTSPPTVTISGTPVIACRVRFEVNVAGSGGVASPNARGRWTINYGRGWVQQDVPLTPTVELKPLGVTLNFSNATYPNNAVYTIDMSVGQWNDKSGKGVIPFVAQEIAGRMPSFNPLAPNAAGLSFSAPGVNRLYTSGINIPQPFSFFVVAKAATQTPVRSIIGAANPGACPVLYANSGTQMAINFGTQIAGNVDATALHGYIGLVNGATSSLLVDGVQIATGALGTNPMTELYVGASLNPSGGYWDQYIDELVFFSGLLSADEIAALTSRSRAKWGTP